MATTEELNLMRSVRREFAKKPIDSSRLEMQCIRGRLYLSGTITSHKDAANVSVKNEIADLVLRISKMTGVKQVINECKMIEGKPKAPAHGQSHGEGGASGAAPGAGGGHH